MGFWMRYPLVQNGDINNYGNCKTVCKWINYDEKWIFITIRQILMEANDKQVVAAWVRRRTPDFRYK